MKKGLFLLLSIVLLVFVINAAQSRYKPSGRTITVPIPTGTAAVVEIVDLINGESIVGITCNSAMTTVVSGMFKFTGDTAADYVTPTAANSINFTIAANSGMKSLYASKVFGQGVIGNSRYTSLSKTVGSDQSLFVLPVDAGDDTTFLYVETMF